MKKKTQVKRHLRRTKRGPKIVTSHLRNVNTTGFKKHNPPLVLNVGKKDYEKIKRARMAVGRLGRPLKMDFVNEAEAAQEIEIAEKRKGRKLKSDELQEVYDEFNIY